MIQTGNPHPRVNPSSSDPGGILSACFHDFGPSARHDLKGLVLKGGEVAFLDALDRYLVAWAQADWLAEDEIERIGVWAQSHLPEATLQNMRDLAGRGAEQADDHGKHVYALLRQGLGPE